jgi:hypothetical protein
MYGAYFMTKFFFTLAWSLLSLSQASFAASATCNIQVKGPISNAACSWLLNDDSYFDSNCATNGDAGCTACAPWYLNAYCGVQPGGSATATYCGTNGKCASSTVQPQTCNVQVAAPTNPTYNWMIGDTTYFDPNGALNFNQCEGTTGWFATQTGGTVLSSFCDSSGSCQSIGSNAQASVFTAPPQAVAAGYKTLTFDDEFDSPNSISPTGTGNYKWYPKGWFTNTDGSPQFAPPTSYSVHNGMLTINTDYTGYGWDLATAAPGGVGKTFQHGYFEASIQYDPKYAKTGLKSWPAFWSKAIESTNGAEDANTAELDFFEAYPTGTGKTSTLQTIHDWKSVGGKLTNKADTKQNAAKLPAGYDPTQFHTLGCLWEDGTISMYVDNKLVGVSLSWKPGSTYSVLDADHMIVILGSGVNWPMNVDWVRIWQ